MTTEYVGAAKPVAPWLGGKSRLAKTLIERIEQIDHETYVEPFVGMGGVFLRRAYRPSSEVINDINGEIINLFRILQRHYPQFLSCLQYQITSRKEFERLVKVIPSTLTDLERAARFLYLQRTSFGGRNTNPSFGVSPTTSARFDLNKVGPLLEAAHERLAGVVFENLPWEKLIATYDRAGTLFYLDPPYYGGESDYGKNIFERSDFAKMAKVLREIKGTFILSINDTPEIRETFDAFIIDEVRLNYSIGSSSQEKEKKEKNKELIISNKSIAPGLI